MDVCPQHEQFLPVAEAARQLETTVVHVFLQIKRGTLVGSELDGSWQVSRQSVEKLRSAGPAAGRAQASLPGCSRRGSCPSCR